MKKSKLMPSRLIIGQGALESEVEYLVEPNGSLVRVFLAPDGSVDITQGLTLAEVTKTIQALLASTIWYKPNLVVFWVPYAIPVKEKIRGRKVAS